MNNYLICILIVSLVGCGCTQNNTITGEYMNEANTDQYISFGELGTFSHYNYNNRPGFFRMGNYSVNKTLITLFYSDGEVSEFYLDGNEMVQINGNKSDSSEKILENKFAKKLKM